MNHRIAPLSDDIKARIARLRRQGKSYAEIGRIMGIDGKRAADWWRRHGSQYAPLRPELENRPLPAVESTDEFRGPTLAQLMGGR